jgi:hypothetical protein
VDEHEVNPEHIGALVGDRVVCSCGNWRSNKIKNAAIHQWKAFNNHVTDVEQQAGQTPSSDSERRDES